MARITALLVLAAACGTRSSSPARDDARMSAPPVATIDAAAPAPAMDLGGLAGYRGCLVVRFPDGTTRASDDAVCADRHPPMSTFKIVNALIGVDAGVLDGPDAVMRYDRKRYPPERHWADGWAQDNPLRTAIAISSVPLFRRLAVDIGAERMQAKLDAIGYGNRSMASGLDRFWLGGSLAISAPEQIDVIARLLASTLPVSARAHEVVREVIPREAAADGAVLHAKTGTGSLGEGKPWVGWLVGWVERGGQTYPFACWIEGPIDDVTAFRDRRSSVCKAALARLGLFGP